MFKSIFTKLLVTYLTIMICVITVISLVLYYAFTSYVFKEKNKTLINASSRVSQIVKNYSTDKISIQELQSSINTIGSITDSKVYVLKIDKELLKVPEQLKNIDQELSDGELKKNLEKILNGDIVSIDNLYSKKLDSYMVFVGVPLRVNSKEIGSREISGAIVFFSPVSELSKHIKKINIVIWITAIISILISAIIIYITSQKISRPIKEIQQASVYIAMGKDISDIKINSKDEIGNLAKSFNHMKFQILNTEKLRRDFIASVSHDLRTPLTSIKGFIQGMLDGIVKPQDTQKYLEIIQAETKRLIKLTGELLEIAKIQSGTVELKKEAIKIYDLLEYVKEITEPIIKEKSITLRIVCPNDLIIYVDPDKFMQIILNLVSNAIKYNIYNGCVFVIVTQQKEFVEFNIKDTGIGISSEELPFIFDQFYRVDKSRQSSENGSGLGLNIVKKLVELHGGKIDSKSELEIGTEITFTIPNK